VHHEIEIKGTGQNKGSPRAAVDQKLKEVQNSGLRRSRILSSGGYAVFCVHVALNGWAGR
jgi:hypothetical protein